MALAYGQADQAARHAPAAAGALEGLEDAVAGAVVESAAGTAQES